MKITRLLTILSIILVLLLSINSHNVMSYSGFVMSGSAKPEKDIGEALDISAQTAVVIELNTGKVLYSKNAQQKVYPASTTKILTALIALEECNLDDIVTITEKASGVEGSSIYLEVGEKISYRDLLYGLMLRSGNDAAIAISDSISGSTEKFAEKMNERAKMIGAVNSNFVNPSGLFNENHYTTAYDMALIAREAMKIPEFREIAASKSYVADRGEGKYNTFYNKNKVVFEYEGGTGIKIGYTKASGRTLVASSERDGMELICVVMNAHNWFNDSYRLMDYGYEKYELARLASAERILKAVLVNQGDKDYVFIGPKEDIIIPIKKDETSEISIAYNVLNTVDAPIRRWDEVGTLDIFIDGEYIGAQPLYYLEDIDLLVDETRIK